MWNLEIRRKSKVTDCRYRIKKLKLDFASHGVRSEEGRWEIELFFWPPRGKKKKGE